MPLKKFSAGLTAILAIITAVALTTPVQAASTLQPISNASYGSYSYGNGDKVAVGRFNTLHTVWESGALVKYSTSADGANWTSPTLVAPGIPAAQPAIASDSNGTLVVAFVGNPSFTTGLGSIHYAYRPWGSTTWTVSRIVNSGMQPDIEARGGTVHVTWTTIDRVQYTSFPTTSPPAAMNFGEEIEVDTCPGSGFLWPSVTLVRENCKLVPKVAYMRYSDEIGNPNPVCASLITEVGPRVCERDPSNGTWSLEYTDLVTATTPAQGVDALALSMNGQYSSGNVFVAWSDSSNGNARTRLAHGRNGSWNAITHDTDEHHVHVAAKRNSPDGEFRFTWVSEGWLTPFFVDTDAQFRTGKWHSGAAPTWTNPTSTYINASLGPALVGHPQGIFWGQCTGGDYVTVETVSEIENICASPGLVVHRTDNQSCPGVTPIGFNPCDIALGPRPIYTTRQGAYTLVDVDTLGEPVESGETWATYGLFTEESEGWITVSWDHGRVVSTWDGGFSIDNPKARLWIESHGVEAKPVALESNGLYDDLGPLVCEKP